MFICKNCTPSLLRRSCCVIEEEIEVGDFVHREGRRCSMLEESHPQKRKEIREQKPDPEGRKRVQR